MMLGVLCVLCIRMWHVFLDVQRGVGAGARDGIRLCDLYAGGGGQIPNESQTGRAQPGWGKDAVHRAKGEWLSQG